MRSPRTAVSVLHRKSLPIADRAPQVLSRVAEAARVGKSDVHEWLRAPHCNLPLRHPLWAKFTPQQRRGIWQGLTHYLEPKCIPIDRVAHIALENFHTDLPFSERADFLQTSLAALLGQDFADRTSIDDVLQPEAVLQDPFFEDGIRQATLKDFWLSWRAYHAVDKADFIRGVIDAESVSEIALEDVVSFVVQENPSSPYNRFQVQPSLSDAYLEGVTSLEPIGWVSALSVERLYSLFLRNDRLRRIVFGKYANAGFTENDVRVKFARR